MFLVMDEENENSSSTKKTEIAILLQKSLAIKPLMKAMNERGLLADDRKYFQLRINQIEDEIRETIAQLEGRSTWLDSKFRSRKTEQPVQKLDTKKAA